LFLQAEYELSRYFRPSVGMRYDSFGGDYANNDPGQTSYTQDMKDFQHFSPKLGFRSMLLDGLDFRASYCQGFALPGGEAKYQSNMDVDPETIEQWEAGLTYTLGSKLWIDAAYFIIDTSDEIQEYPQGSGEYKNLGKTRRNGLEAAIKYSPLAGLELFGNVTFMDSEIKTNTNQSLEGKEVTGVPKHILNLGVQYTSSLGLGGRIKWRQTGSYYIDDANTEEYDGYDTVDLGLFYDMPFGKNGDRRLRIRFDILNLFDERYSQAVWSGYGTTNYALSWPRTFWLGFNLDW
jgi:iron complex outermembrane recepter protein